MCDVWLMKNGKSIAWLIWKEGLKLSSKLLKKRFFFEIWVAEGGTTERKWKVHCLWYWGWRMKTTGLQTCSDQMVCRLSPTNFPFRQIYQMSRKVWYLNEEWKLLVCRLGSDQLCTGIVCRLRLSVWLVCRIVLTSCAFLHLKFEGWDCLLWNVCTSMIGLRILNIRGRAEWKSKEEVRKCWDRAGQRWSRA